jgi:hypothetical protein
MEFRLIRSVHVHEKNWQMSWLGASDRTLYAVVIYDLFGRCPTIQVLALNCGAVHEDEVRTIFDLRVSDDRGSRSFLDARQRAFDTILLDHTARAADLQTGSSKIQDEFGSSPNCQLAPTATS